MNNTDDYIRKDFELPKAIQDWNWKYHHIGIPTTKKQMNEKYISKFKMYVSGFNVSPFGIEWIRFDNNSPINKLIQEIPHIAFQVENIDLELSKRNFKILTEPNSPSANVRVAMIEHNGAPIELIEFKKINKD